ncbi:MAG: hypothetical protein M1814_002970 [Vezdaea aestivalis]|nr:MAG: hypothetical protein M1814_002970 [Vezdaea aestivalis]
MLDSFEILTTSGVVLWSKSFAPVSQNAINSLIAEVFIEEKVAPGSTAASDVSATKTPPFKKDQFTLKWTTFKELGLIFVAVYQSLIHLGWVDKLLDNIKVIFVDLYKDQLRKPHTSIVEVNFDNYFDQQLRELEDKAPAVTKTFSTPLEVEASSFKSQDGETARPPLPGLLSMRKATPNASSDVSPVITPDTSRPTTPLTNHLVTATKGPGGKGSRRARKALNQSAHASSGDEASIRKSKTDKSAVKKPRKWDADGLADESEDIQLDYSSQAAGTRAVNVEDVASDSFGTRNKKGQFILKDLDDEIHSILSTADSTKGEDYAKGVVGTGIGAISGLFRNVVGGKTLTKADLEKPMKGMEEHLLKKNVAPEAVKRLCEGVEESLVGVKTGNFQSESSFIPLVGITPGKYQLTELPTGIDSKIHTAMEASLRKILTPTSSLDLLREIQTVISPSMLSTQKAQPYVISIVGVNGVGKSTNLSKICFFLLQNKFRVLITACDTFRSGAVEQLRVHVRNLKELGEREGGHVDLYEKGYGKDPAHIAKDAVEFAANQGFDVVLIDTAGRRHNDQRLMSSLEKFAKFAQPHKILMVGEALVGTDSVQQARNFNAAFGAGRSLDGFIISKCDTVGDMVGTLVSMVHACGIPVLFLGVGQHYGDLRTLNISWAVKLLMS